MSRFTRYETKPSAIIIFVVIIIIISSGFACNKPEGYVIPSTQSPALPQDQSAVTQPSPTVPAEQPTVTTDHLKEYQDLLSTIKNRDYAEWAQKNNLCFEDGILTELEKNFLRNPVLYGEEIFKEYMTEIKGENPELAMELEKLPDLQDIKSQPAKKVEAIEDILSLTDKSKYDITFELILNEGIKEKRKYSTPLEALLWCTYDYENNFLETKPWIEKYKTMMVEEDITLSRYAWENTTISNNYKSEKWTNFDEVADRLNSPLLIFLYEKRNFSYYHPGSYWIAETARETFRTKRGDCGNQSIFAVDLLKRNGYEGYCLFIEWRADGSGHVVALYREDKNNPFNYLDITGRYQGNFGPFKSTQEAIDNLVPSLKETENFTNFTVYFYNEKWIEISRPN